MRAAAFYVFGGGFRSAALGFGRSAAAISGPAHLAEWGWAGVFLISYYTVLLILGQIGFVVGNTVLFGALIETVKPEKNPG